VDVRLGRDAEQLRQLANGNDQADADLYAGQHGD
jgi:hypothetical protein